MHSYNVRSSQNYRPVFSKPNIKIFFAWDQEYMLGFHYNVSDQPNFQILIVRLFKQLIIDSPLFL